MQANDTQLIPPARFPSPASLANEAWLKFTLAVCGGVVVGLTAPLVGKLLGVETLGGPAAVPLGVGAAAINGLVMVVGQCARRRDSTVSAAADWYRVVLITSGHYVPPHSGTAKVLVPWSSLLGLLACVPLGWLALLIVLLCRLLRQRWVARSYPPHLVVELRSLPDVMLQEYLTWPDASSARTASGSFFGWLVISVPYATRIATFKNWFLTGPACSVAAACVWLFPLHTLSVPAAIWWLGFGVHAVGLPLLWWLGVCRLRQTIAADWVEALAARTSSLPVMTTPWDYQTVPLRDTTAVVDGVSLEGHFVLAWAMPDISRPSHPHATVDGWQLPIPAPIVVDLSVLDGHVYMSGGTGSGKTTLGMMPLLLHLIDGVYKPVIGPDGQPVRGLDGQVLRMRQPDGPLLIFELKGDSAFYHVTERDSVRAGRRFMLFAVEPQIRSVHFNPFVALNLPNSEDIERATMYLSALGLDTGEGYGPSFFASQNRWFFQEYLPKMQRAATPDRVVVEDLLRGLDPADHQNALHAIATLKALGAYSRLRPPPAGVEEIRWEEVIEQNAVVYCWLPLSVTSMLSRQLLRLMLFTFAAAMRRHVLESPSDRKNATIIIDEAQALAGIGVDVLFQQSRSSRIRLVLANQSPRDLISKASPFLADLVETNTRLKIHFTVPTVADQERIIRLSGSQLIYLRSETHTSSTSTSERGDPRTSTGQSTTYQPQVVPRLTSEDITMVNNTPGTAILMLNPDTATSKLGGRPVIVTMTHVVTMEEYNRLAALPMPKPAPAPAAESPAGTTQQADPMSPAAESADDESFAQAVARNYHELTELYEERSGRRLCKPK